MFVEIFTFCFDSRVMHFMFDLTHFKKNTKQTSNIWSVKVDFLSDSVKRGILRYSFKVLNAVFAFVCHKWDNRNVIMMCFLAAGLVWLLAGLCHALGINTQVGAAVTEAEMLGFFPLCISAHSHPVWERPRLMLLWISTKTTNWECTASLMKSNFTTCVGCLKRHVGPPRAPSLCTSPVQTVRAPQGICAAINSVMIF